LPCLIKTAKPWKPNKAVCYLPHVVRTRYTCVLAPCKSRSGWTVLQDVK